MIQRLGLTPRHQMEIEAYAMIEPIGEGMVDYMAADKAQPKCQTDEEMERAAMAAAWAVAKKDKT